MKPVIFNEALKIWDKLSAGEKLKEFELEIEINKRLLNIFQVGNYYYYIFNLIESKFDLVSEEIYSVLGYDPKSIDVPTFLSLIHPDDQPWFLNFENKVNEFFNKLKPKQVPNYKVRYDYRVRKSNGEYIRILQQVITIQHNKTGGVLRTLGIHTDISHFKTEGIPLLSFIGLNGEPSYIDVDVKKIFSSANDNLTKREREILSLLVSGKETKEIADLLNISPLTVSKHRQNLLLKTQVRNTAELIQKSINNGWV